MNRDTVLLAASVLLAVVGVALVLVAIDALVGGEWAKLAAGAVCVYAAYSVSTYVGPAKVVIKKPDAKGDDK